MERMKFYGTSSLLLLSLSSLLIISEAATVKRLCYWCGPLAEQVHRSSRALPCDASEEPVITKCEPEFPYCAVVATSPPYVESRLCVKLYQDECYPLYCNSTKTWKMTCPCRDDLCNGANTERENEAFSILDRLVAKTKTSRIKKRSGITAAQFIPSGIEKTQIVNNVSAFNNIPNDSNIDGKDDRHKTHIIIANELTENSYEKNDGNLLNHISFEEPIDEYPTTMSEIKIEKNTNINEHKTPIIENEIINSYESDDLDLTSKLSPPEATDEFLLTVSELKFENLHNNLQTSEELPTAEALQQNTSPKTNEEKSTPSSIEEITDITATDDVDITTEIMTEKKNSASTLYKQYIICLNAFIFNYCLVFFN